MLGAVRVELRGLRGSGHDAEVYGALDRPAVAAGTVAAVAATWTTDGRLSRTGAGGLAELIDEPVPFLQELARRGVRAAVFEGVAADSSTGRSVRTREDGFAPLNPAGTRPSRGPMQAGQG
jgi:hypothetical protein